MRASLMQRRAVPARLVWCLGDRFPLRSAREYLLFSSPLWLLYLLRRLSRSAKRLAAARGVRWLLKPAAVRFLAATAQRYGWSRWTHQAGQACAFVTKKQLEKLSKRHNDPSETPAEAGDRGESAVR